MNEGINHQIRHAPIPAVPEPVDKRYCDDIAPNARSLAFFMTSP